MKESTYLDNVHQGMKMIRKHNHKKVSRTHNEEVTKTHFNTWVYENSKLEIKKSESAKKLQEKTWNENYSTLKTNGAPKFEN